MDKTLQTLEEVGENTTLASPELYIIVNGRPTKSKVVWCTLVAAVSKLRKSTGFTSTFMKIEWTRLLGRLWRWSRTLLPPCLRRPRRKDIADMHCYTVRSLNSKQFTGDDMEQCKLVNVEEHPMDNRHKFLDVMCIPALFPEGQFGEYHQRDHKLSHSEYIKSRLLSNDSQFRKDPRYIFYYLLWLKEMRELSAGVYNVLKSHSARPMSAGNIMSKLDANDQQLEANLSTMLQTVHGTKYWFTNQTRRAQEYG